MGPLWEKLSDYRLEKLNTESVFTDIYRKNVWGDKESVSGAGSNLAQTEIIRTELAKLIKKLAITTILDIPCGDFYWMRLVDLNGIKYIGADIVKPLIQDNNVKYGKEMIEFRNLDLLKDPLPKADLILCRDCLVHLSFADIFIALKNICQSGSTYLLTTTFTERQNNDDIITGRYHNLNLTITPFNFPAPILVINEQCTEREGDEEFTDKSLALWKIADIAKILGPIT